jgi:hypothetical protein
MKTNLLLSLTLAFAVLAMAVLNAQNLIKQAPSGFDSMQANIPHGKIDTISYNSKTVGVTRRALIYTPPGFSKRKNIRYCIYCMALAEI